jgi:hypothetical protein
MTISRHLAALQPVSRLRRAEAAVIAEESANTTETACGQVAWTRSDPTTGWTARDWAEWDAWCMLEDERITRLHAEEAEAERDRYRLARLSHTNPHD